MFCIKPLQQCLGFVEGEDVAAFRNWIELIRELRFHAGRFVRKWQWFPPFRINVEKAFTVLPRLFFYSRQCVTFRLRLNCADRFAIDEKEIIDFIAIFQESFANRNSLPC